jgi:thioredoxin reductase (NADPH)
MTKYTSFYRTISSALLVVMIVSLPACATGTKNEPTTKQSSWQSLSNWGREKLSALYNVVRGKSTKSNLKVDKSLITGNEYAVAIIGSGPAGLAAALTTGRYMLKTVMIDGPLPGGQLTETSMVENWLGEPRIAGQALINKFTEHVDQYGVEHLADTVTGVDFTQWPFELTTETGKKIRALTVVIATGAAPVRLNMPGEDDFYGRGLSTCAICDAGLYDKDKDEVLIIGGGDTASEMALQLAEHAKKVTLLVRKDRMRSSASIQERMNAYPHINVMYNVEVKGIEGSFKQTFRVIMKSEEKVANSKAEADAIMAQAKSAGNEVRVVRDEPTGAKTLKIITQSEKRVAKSKAEERKIQEEARAAGYDIEFVGPESEVKLTGVKVLNVETGQTSVIPANGAFLAIGHAPSTKLFKGIVPMHDNGTIEVIGRTQATEIPGVFAAGEAADDRYKQVIWEAGEGNGAGLDVWRFLQGINFNNKMLKPGSAFAETKGTGQATMVPVATLEEFDKEVVNSALPVIVDIWSEGCVGCKKMEPALEATAQEAAGRVKIVKINGGTAREILLAIKDRYGVFIRHMPFVLAFKGGQLVSQFATVMSKDDFAKLVEHLEGK